MDDKTQNPTGDGASVLPITDRETWQTEIDALRERDTAHTSAGNAIAPARRRLPMVEVDAAIPLIGPEGPVTLLETFAGRG